MLRGVSAQLSLAFRSSWVVESLVVQEYTRLPLVEVVVGISLVYYASLLGEVQLVQAAYPVCLKVVLLPSLVFRASSPREVQFVQVPGLLCCVKAALLVDSPTRANLLVCGMVWCA
jgi:hypothetical protein